MPSYQRPILVEIVAQMRFGAPGISGAQIVDAAAFLRAKGFESADLEVQAEPPLGGEGPGLASTLRLWSADRTRLVQFRPSACIANIIGEYPGWTPFTRHLAESLKALEAAGLKKLPDSVSLATIDRFQVPANRFRLGDYLAATGKWIPTSYAEVAEASDITLGRGLLPVDGKNRVVKVAVRRASEGEAQVTLECVLIDRLEGARPESVYDRLHDEALALFEELITDKTRTEVMGGIKVDR
jgi:uncharacterized protein (TIGR04255 family)